MSHDPVRVDVPRSRWVLPILLATTSTVVALVAVVRPDRWMVERVAFSGHERASVAVLRHLADLPNGTPPWSVNPERVARRIEQHPWVSDATVEVRWPDQVHIGIVEHETVALLRRDQALYAVGRTGQVFLQVQDDVDHPVITGFTPEVEARRHDLARVALPDALRLIEGLTTRELVAERDISEVAFSSAGFTVHTRGARLAFGHGHLPRQLDRLGLLVSRGLDLDAPVHVDVAPATVAVVRPR